MNTDNRFPSELETKLASCKSLPSPPSYALRILELASDPDVDIDKAVKVFSADPAIVGKILRMANSPLYGHQRTIDTLPMAILTLGLNAAVSLGLSFSMVQSLHAGTSSGLNHKLYWRRTGFMGAASRVIGHYFEGVDLDGLFVGALLQDIGMLALDQVFPSFYTGLDMNEHNHATILSHEESLLGVNHARVGGWLLEKWNFPERLHWSVTHSEDPTRFPEEHELARFVRMVAYSGVLSHLYLAPALDEALSHATEKGEMWLGLDPAHFPELLGPMTSTIAEIENMFELNIRGEHDPERIVERAREVQEIRTFQVYQAYDQLTKTTAGLKVDYERLNEESRRDGLTQLFNRATLDEYLAQAFQHAIQTRTLLSVGFLDLDNFKQVNDTYGHAVGDQILKTTGEILKAQIRTTDLAGRYGGEEFIVALPETPPDAAEMVFARIVEAFRNFSHDIGRDQPLQVTISLGFSTHSPTNPYPDVASLVQAADKALYAAKSNGGDASVTLDRASVAESTNP